MLDAGVWELDVWMLDTTLRVARMPLSRAGSLGSRGGPVSPVPTPATLMGPRDGRPPRDVAHAASAGIGRQAGEHGGRPQEASIVREREVRDRREPHDRRAREKRRDQCERQEHGLRISQNARRTNGAGTAMQSFMIATTQGERPG